MKLYYIHVPGFVYASNFYGKNKNEALNAFRQWAKIERMPRGYAIWEA